jgi:hypothetical protein
MAFEDEKITVESKIQSGGVLWLKLHSEKILDSKLCTTTVIETLKKIKLKKITSVKISLMITTDGKVKSKWNRYLSIQNGEFVDDTKNTNLIGLLLIGVILSWVGCSVLTNQSSSNNPATSSQPSTQITNPDCVYLPESTITGKNWKEINEFKDEIKRQTGKKCVIFTGS